MMDTEVAIIGGGLAGLNAARLLHTAGIEFLLLEARATLGGRIQTVNETGRPDTDGFDLGPSWFWPRMQPAIAALVAELDLPTFAQNSDGDVVFERMSREAARRYPGLSQEPEALRLVGGSAALIRELARDLPEARLLCGTQVTEMRLSDAGVGLSVRFADGRGEIVQASQVIAALPPRILQATVRFEPPQEPATVRLWQETPTWMAPHAKFFAVYDRPFWREAGLSGTAQSMVGPLAEIHDATTSSGSAALFGFVGMAAEQRAAIGEEALTHACIQQLARIFGPQAAHPRATLYKDWAADPLTATSTDWFSAGHPHTPDDGWITGPWKERLALAGSETSPNEAGYLAGAVEASAQAAAEVIQKFAANKS
ncbi:flavin monoamine oxidase family protein [Sinorhizobium americanum]|uniref:Amine oxidase n=1 Tax=Sinorhizobium americanum TaxID=194963 RepID=A0A1L3LQ47_9HYPH|nr:FAD-dependent oxidoreductase [Sinorhizobium americanum]APG92201.1 amine oxidase [Sinorhizobium americanum]OAP34659.1 amine oxidase [Sinorhizobium americanum]